MGKWLLVAVGVVAVDSFAHAAVLCSGPGGLVRVRDACKPRETQVDPVALGLQGPQGVKGDKGDPGLAGPPGPGAVVRDANGNLVGAVVDSAPNPDSPVVRVVRGVADRTLAFLVGVDTSGYFVGFVQSGFELHYESNDCSGTAFLAGFLYGPSGCAMTGGQACFVDYPPPVPEVHVIGTRAAYQAGPVVTHTIRSRKQFNDETSCCENSSSSCSTCSRMGVPVCPGSDGRFFTPPDECCIPYGPTSEGVPDVTTFDLDTLGLVPPFHIEGP